MALRHRIAKSRTHRGRKAPTLGKPFVLSQREQEFVKQFIASARATYGEKARLESFKKQLHPHADLLMQQVMTGNSGTQL